MLTRWNLYALLCIKLLISILTSKHKNDPHIWASLRGLAGSRAAKIRIILDNTNFSARKISEEFECLSQTTVLPLISHLHNGSFCQLTGNPMAQVSTIGYFSSNAIRSCLKVFCCRMISTKCFRMQSVKNTRPCWTLFDIHGVDGRVIVRARNDKKRFHKRAWWQQVFLVKVTMVIHDVNTGMFSPKYCAIFLRNLLLAMFS